MVLKKVRRGQRLELRWIDLADLRCTILMNAEYRSINEVGLLLNYDGCKNWAKLRVLKVFG